MATKTYRTRFINSTAVLDAALERTHYVFVECLRQMIERYLDMRKGKYGEECRELIDIILSRSNTFAHGVIDQLSRAAATTSLSDPWTDLAKRVHKKQGPLFSQHEGFAVVDGTTIHTKPLARFSPAPGKLAVPAKFWHQVCDSASTYLKSNSKLMEQWRKDRKEWLNDRSKWEQENLEFMRFWNGPYRQFEEACEQKRKQSQLAAGERVIPKLKESRERGKRVERWHLWYDWILSHPEIIEWRGCAKLADFKTVPLDIQRKIMSKYPKQHKYIPELLKWLKQNNPELAALDTRRAFYVRTFIRFRRPPTLTLPTPYKHPYWFTFELNVFYKDVDFEKGTIRLLLIDQKDDGAWSFEWCDAKLKCDPRLKPSFRAKLFSKEGRYPPYS